jgi:Phage endonuclease I
VRPRYTKTRKQAVKDGFRSGFEAAIAKDLEDRGIKYEYEKHVIKYNRTLRGGSCGACGSKAVVRVSRYTPDYYLPEYRLWVEAKGRWTSSDRTKLVAFVSQYPEHKFRVLLQRDNKINKGSGTTYSQWAAKHGITAAVGKSVPQAWLS